MKIITRKKFDELKKECINYETTKSLLTKCINEVYCINFKMFEELMVLLHSYAK